MKNAVYINVLILLSVGLAGFALTVYLNERRPTIIVQPEAPAETISNKYGAPDFTFQVINGEQYSLQQFKGKIVLLNFWASWCPPCVKEFPHFIEVANKHSEDVIFIGLSSDVAEKTMMKFVRKLENSMGEKLDADNILIAHDKDEVTHRLFQTYKLPETIIIDQSGQMREKLVGADWTIEYLEKRIEELNSE